FLTRGHREMKQLVEDEVIPHIQQKNGEQVIESTVLRFIGIGESIVEDRLKELIQMQENPTIAPLAQQDGVTIRLSAKAASVEEAWVKLNREKQQIQERLGKYYVESVEKT